MADYEAAGDQTLVSPLDTALSIVAITATLRRARVYEFMGGVGGTPADNAITWRVQRVTAPGTATTVVPTATDDADVASQMNVGSNHTVEPTYVAGAFLFGPIEVHQRSNALWRALKAGAEWVIPAVNDEGLGFAAVHASATNPYSVTARWSE